ncbi:MAG TPA: hypothetical protein VM754_06620, partial [Actinomycetota bacterium]|nr:hypothetical protein [Actinomycetota bacterium]
MQKIDRKRRLLAVVVAAILALPTMVLLAPAGLASFQDCGAAANASNRTTQTTDNDVETTTTTTVAPETTVVQVTENNPEVEV